MELDGPHELDRWKHEQEVCLSFRTLCARAFGMKPDSHAVTMGLQRRIIRGATKSLG